jgi:hypothetical protein
MHVHGESFGSKVMHDIRDLRSRKADLFKFLVVGKDLSRRAVIRNLSVIYNDQSIRISGNDLHTVGDQYDGYTAL